MMKSKKGKPDSHPTHEKSATQDERYASFSKIYEQARQLQGEQISPKALLDSGDTFVVRNYFKRHSRFEGSSEYVAVEIELPNGQRRFFYSGSEPLRDQLDRTAVGMPYRAKLVTKKSASGRTYTTLA
ncbi:MAG: hypothetical protein AB1806_15300 [Acidobacteriota bacterium]